MTFWICFAASFLLGAIPTAFLVARYFRKIDIRQYGSGNVGATNAFRVLGKAPGLFVLAVDFAKGCLPVYLYLHFFRAGDPGQAITAGLWLGLGAILGHLFTPFLGFKGGKGIATGAGVLLASSPLYFSTAIATWVLVLVVTRVVAMASLSAVAILVLFSFIRNEPRAVEIYFLMMLSLTIWTHRTNLRKLREDGS